MFLGSGYKTKNEIIVIMIISLLEDGYLNPQDIRNKFNITSITLYRYISFLKNVLVDNNFYYIDIEYDYSNKIYRCKSRTKFRSSFFENWLKQKKDL